MKMSAVRFEIILKLSEVLQNCILHMNRSNNHLLISFGIEYSINKYYKII